MTAARRHLIVRISAIGDAIVASSLLTRIRSQEPTARITWLCGAAIAPLVERFDGLDDVIVIDDAAILRGGVVERVRTLVPLWRRLMTRRFDAVWLLHVDRRYRLLIPPLSARRVAMLSRSAHGRMNPVPGRYLGDEYARLLDGPAQNRGPIVERFPLAQLRAGADVEGRTPTEGAKRRREEQSQDTPSLPASSRPRVAIAPGGARNLLRDDPLRRWPVERYADVATALVRSGCEVVLVGGATDAWVQPHFSGVQVVDTIGTLGLVETASLLRTCALVITHDTGPLHLARLVRVPVLALFGPTVPRQVVGEEALTTVLWGGAHLPCRPCFDGREFANCRDNVCIKSITADAVVTKALEMLASRAGQPNH